MKKGFTLIELLVAITIVVILMGISLFAIAGARSQGRDARRQSDLESIRTALEFYKADCNSYPATAAFPAVGSPLVGSGSPASCAMANHYIESRPGDPQNPTKLYYYSMLTTTTYELCAALEGGGSASCAGTCGSGVTCTYRVTNP